jgi:hypothetical protein
MWSRVIGEVHDFFCTNSKTYEKERSEATGLVGQGITVIATSLGAAVNIGIALVTGLVTVAFILVSKMGRNAWCKWAAENFGISGKPDAGSASPRSE